MLSHVDSKSMTISNKLQQSNYSALSNLPKHVINQIKAEGNRSLTLGELYLSAP